MLKLGMFFLGLCGAVMAGLELQETPKEEGQPTLAEKAKEAAPAKPVKKENPVKEIVKKIGEAELLDQQEDGVKTPLPDIEPGEKP
jgi:hypothetical protein